MKNKQSKTAKQSKTKQNKNMDTEMICCICSNDLHCYSIFKTCCGHSYHEKCLFEWTDTFSNIHDINCPICRGKILTGDNVSQFTNRKTAKYNNIRHDNVNPNIVDSQDVDVMFNSVFNYLMSPHVRLVREIHISITIDRFHNGTYHTNHFESVWQSLNVSNSDAHAQSYDNDDDNATINNINNIDNNATTDNNSYNDDKTNDYYNHKHNKRSIKSKQQINRNRLKIAMSKQKTYVNNRTNIRNKHYSNRKR